MVSKIPEERALIASLAAHERWARTSNRTAATEPARRAAGNRFEKQVDPDGSLDPITRAKLAENAKKAHFKRLALLSAQARRLRSRAAQLEAQVIESSQDAS